MDLNVNQSTPPQFTGGVQREVPFMEAISMGFNKYVQFGGRSSRSEFWWWELFSFLAGVCAECAGYLLGEWVAYFVSVALFIPCIMVTCRRLHDIGKGAGYIFLGLIPVVGWIILIIWYCKPSEPQTNRFGDVPNLV